MNSSQHKRGLGFWIGLAIVTAVFLASPFFLLESSEGADGFQDLVFFISFIFLFSLETLIAIIAGLVLITKRYHAEVGRGILAGLVVGAIGGFVISFILVRLVLR